MIASYIFTNETWQLLDAGANLVDTFYLPDTYLFEPAAGASAGVLMSEDNTNHTRFISNAEIVAMGLTNVAGLTAQFGTDKTSSSGVAVPISSAGGTVTQPNIGIGLDAAPNLTATSKDNIFIGRDTGANVVGTADNNVVIGNRAGSVGIFDNGDRNIVVGYLSGGSINSGRENVLLGTQTGYNITDATDSVFLGWHAGYNTTTGTHNVFLGRSAGAYNVTGGYNVMIGHNSGYNATGDDNVFLGHFAGYSETGNNKLYISNNPSSSPLIHGDFSTGILTINSTFVIATQTAAVASALTPVEGMIVVVSSTDATFTSTGSWIYEGAAWTKITVV